MIRWSAWLALGLAQAAPPPTFSKDVAPILFEYCAPCHRPGEAGPFPLLSYADARRWAPQIAKVTAKRYMPPWPPEPGYGEFDGARRLSQAQIATLARWVEAGAPAGDPRAAPVPPRFPEGWQLGPPDLIVPMRQPYLLPAEKGDVFRNFVLPVDLKETRHIRAIEIHPGNKRVVHHANLVVDRSRMLRRRDGEDGQPGFPGMEVITEAAGEFDPDSHFLFWKPGTPPRQEPAELAWRLDPGNDLVLNLHLQPSGKPEKIDALVGLYFASGPGSRHPMLLQLEHDGALDIPPGAPRFTVTDQLELPAAVELRAIYPHAHYIGKQFEAWAELPGGQTRQLLLIRDWDINWQAVYTYKTPQRLPGGTVVKMRITYDNSAENPRNPGNPPRRVKGGNRSEDEMSHVWLQVIPEEPAAGPDPRLLLQQALMRRRREKYPADFAAHFNLGAAMQALGQDREAIPFLEAAVKIRPDSATARNSLAASLLSADRAAEAEEQLRQALEKEPGYGAARFNLARVLAARGETSGAAEQCRLYLASYPDDAAAHELAAGIELARGELPQALDHLRRVAELKPKDADAQTNYGSALAMSGNLRAAIAAFERALRIDPNHAAARENLARARASRPQ